MFKAFMVLAAITVMAFSLAALTGALHAAPASKPITGKHDNNAPITVSSDSFRADLTAKTGTYFGNVIVVQGDTKLRSNQLRITTLNGNADKIYASGNVVVDSPSGTATGESGVYSVGPRTVVMTGNVVLHRGKDVLTGSRGTFDMNTGQMVVNSGVKTPGATSTRVRTVFTPNSQSQ
jgi:lipopolysaccharide export system protein LptA